MKEFAVGVKTSVIAGYKMKKCVLTINLFLPPHTECLKGQKRSLSSCLARFPAKKKAFQSTFTHAENTTLKQRIKIFN
jgi:hypothetical protein